MRGTAAHQHSPLGSFHVWGSRQRTAGRLWSELRMREQVWASWFPRCLLLIITAHAPSVSAGRDLGPCDEVSAWLLVFFLLLSGVTWGARKRHLISVPKSLYSSWNDIFPHIVMRWSSKKNGHACRNKQPHSIQMLLLYCTTRQHIYKTFYSFIRGRQCPPHAADRLTVRFTVVHEHAP